MVFSLFDLDLCIEEYTQKKKNVNNNTTVKEKRGLGGVEHAQRPATILV